MNAPCTIIVMAKAPVAGYAKTRLVPALGAEGAARLAKRLLDRAVKQALAAHLGEVNLCCAPDTSHPAFVALHRLPGVTLSEQGEGDLGMRMLRAFERVLARSSPVLMIGTDAPSLDAASLRHAAATLRTHDAVITPAYDGGYALIGLRKPTPSLFDGIAWSTPQVLAQTRRRLIEAHLSCAELPPVHDVDEPADLSHLPPELLAGLTTEGIP